MKSAIIVSLLAIGPACGFAQSNFMISYPIGFPMGNLHDYTTSTSFRGINVEFNKKVAPNQTVGLETGWNVFYQHVDKKVYTEGTQSITGVQYRYTNAVPIIAGGKFYFESKKTIHPYVGVGLGTLYVDRYDGFRYLPDQYRYLAILYPARSGHRSEGGVGGILFCRREILLGFQYERSGRTALSDGESRVQVYESVKAGNEHRQKKRPGRVAARPRAYQHLHLTSINVPSGL